MEQNFGSKEALVHEEHQHEEKVLKEVSKRNDYFLGACILAAAVLIAGSVVYSLGKKSGGTGDGGTASTTPGTVTTKTPELASSDVILGDAKAPVTLIEFADYQCPFCARFHEQAGVQIRDQYIKTGKAKMVYRDFAFLGPESLAAASAAHCAADQSKFWEYHDALFATETKDTKENNGNLTQDLFVKLASGLNMNTAQFTACLTSKKYDAGVLKARDDAGLYGVNSTPTTFINGTMIQGAQPFPVFQAAIDTALKK
ncbi:MAG: thioredoxin domain-containing protein [bacterium]|nr:thioredoxin domain-containing protein [bacterium]